MSAAPAIYVAPSSGVAAGAVFLHVPIGYWPPRLIATSVVSGGLLQIESDFERAWLSAPPRLRDAGVPTLTPTKPRPVVILAVGAAEEDTWHRGNVWGAPRYTYKEHQIPRRGRNVLDLPAAPELGLDEEGFLDFFQVQSIPLAYLQPRFHRCDLSPAAFNALLAAFRACIYP